MTGGPQPTPCIYLDHGEAYGNVGDEAMLINAVRRIRSRIGPCRFILPKRPGSPIPSFADCHTIATPRLALEQLANPVLRLCRPRRVFRQWGQDWLWQVCCEILLHRPVERMGLRAWHAAQAALCRCDAIYCVGAANMNEGARRGALLIKWLLTIRAQRMGIPVIVSSQGIGPFRKSWPLRRTIEVVRRATHFSFRDCGVSRRVLESAGVDTSEFADVGDEAFSLPPASKASAVRFLEQAGVDASVPFCIVQFRSTDYGRRTEFLLPKLAAVLDRLDTAQMVFLPMSRGFHAPADTLCARAIKQHMNAPHRLRVLPCPTDPGLARRLVAMARWVASLSYHLQVFALAESTPVLLLVSGGYYGLKARGLAAWTRNRVPVADLESCSVEELCRLIGDLEGRSKEYGAILAEAARRIQRVNNIPLEALARALAARRSKREESCACV